MNRFVLAMIGVCGLAMPLQADDDRRAFDEAEVGGVEIDDGVECNDLSEILSMSEIVSLIRAEYPAARVYRIELKVDVVEDDDSGSDDSADEDESECDDGDDASGAEEEGDAPATSDAAPRENCPDDSGAEDVDDSSDEEDDSSDEEEQEDATEALRYYEVDLLMGGRLYEIQLDAATGELLYAEHEEDATRDEVRDIRRGLRNSKVSLLRAVSKAESVTDANATCAELDLDRRGRYWTLDMFDAEANEEFEVEVRTVRRGPGKGAVSRLPEEGGN